MTAPTHRHTQAAPKAPRRWVRKSLFILAGFTALATTVPCRADAPLPVVLPAPAHMQATGTSIPLPTHISLQWSTPPTALLHTAVQRFGHRLTLLAGTPVQLDNTTAGHKPFPLSISYTPETPFPSPTMAEGYALDVSPSGITLRAQGPAGVLHGLATLLQLVGHDGGKPYLHPAHIEDTPRFAWRGLLIDTSRHFMPLPLLLRQLDAMEMVKLNVLHLHLSDGSAFRVESLRFPRLQQVGSHGQYYTQDQIHQLVQAAAERGIRLVPEFDTPGHTLAIQEAYPSLAPALPLNTTDRAETNRAALDPTKPATITFVNQLYAEMAALFPDPVFHIGGDEVVARTWLSVPHIQSYMHAHHMATAAELQSAFTRQIIPPLTASGKTVMAWDEVLSGQTPPQTIIESWRGPANTVKATDQGHPTVIAGPYYLDILLPTRAYYETDLFAPRKNAVQQQAAALDLGSAAPPQPDSPQDAPAPDLTGAEKSRILGAEAALWSEIVLPDMLTPRLWPRMAALAEQFWSTPAHCQPATLADRLAIMQARLDTLGLGRANDQEHLLEQLAPGQANTIRTLLDALAPVRNYAHNHEFLAIRHKQPVMEQTFGTLADAADPDSPSASTFNTAALAYAAGNTTLRPDLLRMLHQWADNDKAIQSIAAHNPALAPALPASALLAQLARGGLAALGVQAQPGWQQAAHAALEQARTQIAASATIHGVTDTPQPPADLIQRIVPGITALVSLAETHSNHPAP